MSMTCNNLFMLECSSVSHTWDSFQLAHASFRLYCVRNNHVQSVKLGPRLLGDAPKVNVVTPENEMAEEEGSSSEVSPAIKIYDDDINMKFLLCGVPSALVSFDILHVRIIHISCILFVTRFNYVLISSPSLCRTLVCWAH